MVRPGDVIVGDAEGVVVIPIDVAEEVAHKCYERDQLEGWIQQKVANGESIKNIYPPNEETLQCDNE